MTTYLIVGERVVAGHAPGSNVDDDDLDSCDIAALIEGGHLAPNQQKAVKAETQQEE